MVSEWSASHIILDLIVWCAVCISVLVIILTVFSQSNDVFMRLDLYVVYSSTRRCTECFKRARGYNRPYILKIPLTLQKVKGQQPRIKIVKTDRDPAKLQFSGQLVDHFTVPIHDCGGMKNIFYEMYTEDDYFLQCLPSEDYVNVLVEKYEKQKSPAYPLLDFFLNWAYKATLLMDKNRVCIYFYCTGNISFSNDKVEHMTGHYLSSTSLL